MPRNTDDFEQGHTPKCEDCGKPNADGHFHVQFSEDNIAAMRAYHEAAKLSAAGAEIERTRTVDLSDRNDLVDHLSSDNAHMMGKWSTWRNSHDEDIPGVRPQSDEDFELTDEELRAVHEHEHAKYDDEPFTTLGSSHFHNPE